MSLTHTCNCANSTLARTVNTLVKVATSSRGLIFTATGMGLIAIAWLNLSTSAASMDLPGHKLAQSHEDQTPERQNVIFVNPAAADERSDGSKNAPFKTITQALQAVTPNSVIMLSPGKYSASSGEQFPLKLKPGVSIQGNPQTRGSEIVIEGGGIFLSPTFARQNVAILGANQASLIGVTVTNPHPRGYGLWIESSSPEISHNTFTGSSHDGISITGDSAPMVRGNHFYQNKANGITIYGTSQPEVRENVFENTGFGINIAQKAAPILIGNRISKNRAGIVSQANARPVLRDNTIEGNKEDGLVAIANSQPNLGTKAQPGGNKFRQNGRYAINSSTTKTIPAFGNELATARTSGDIDLAGTVKVAEQLPAKRSPVTQLVLEPSSINTSTQARKLPTADREPANQLPAPQIGSRQPAAPATTTMAPIEIPVPLPATQTKLPTPPKPSSQPQRSQTIQIEPLFPSRSQASQRTAKLDNQSRSTPEPESEKAIEIPVPPAASQSADSVTQGLPAVEPASPTVASQPLPVPSPNIPLGKAPNPSPATTPKKPAPATGNPPAPPTRTAALGLRYRVVVEASTASKQKKVKSIVPGAFRTFSKGKVLMQLGAFSARAKADELLQTVKSKGLKATIEQMDES